MLKVGLQGRSSTTSRTVRTDLCDGPRRQPLAVKRFCTWPSCRPCCGLIAAFEDRRRPSRNPLRPHEDRGGRRGSGRRGDLQPLAGRPPRPLRRVPRGPAGRTAPRPRAWLSGPSDYVPGLLPGPRLPRSRRPQPPVRALTHDARHPPHPRHPPSRVVGEFAEERPRLGRWDQPTSARSPSSAASASTASCHVRATSTASPTPPGRVVEVRTTPARCASSRTAC